MKYAITVLLALLSFQLQAAEPLIDRLIVKFKNETVSTQSVAISSTRTKRMSELARTRLSYLGPMSGLAHVMAFEKPLPLSQARAIAVRVAQDPNVEYAEPNGGVKRALVPSPPPNDPDYSRQWHYFAPSGAQLGGANLPTAWDVARGSTVVVAVIDTGIVSHSDLNANVIGGYDFISDSFIAADGNGRDADPSDPGDWYSAGQCSSAGDRGASNSSWHGTHVSGTVAAVTNNGTGVAGVQQPLIA